MARKGEAAGPRTLAVDVGGSGIKSQVLDARGAPLGERLRLRTPKQATPKQILAIIADLARAQGAFDRASVGFPGVVKQGVVYTAANLGPGWKAYPLAKALVKTLKRPVRVANDADVQGLGVVGGHGVELVVTLGTGFGSVIFVDGHRIHLELGHHPFRKGRTYEEELGHKALKKRGRQRWNRLLREAIGDLRDAFGFDHLYLGGGNTDAIDFKLPSDVSIVKNEEGLLGGIALWRDRDPAPREVSAVVRRRASATEAARGEIRPGAPG